MLLHASKRVGAAVTALVLLGTAPAPATLAQAASAPVSDLPRTWDRGEVLKVWPNGAPDNDGLGPEQTMPFYDRSYLLVRNVADPTLTVVRAAPGTATGAAVVILPGGGYRFLTMESEGMDVARRLARHGVTAFVLKYRTVVTPQDEGGFWQALSAMGRPPADGWPTSFDALGARGLSDLEEGLGLIRRDAARWDVDPAKVGVIGFSAGASLAAQSVLDADVPHRPAFGGLIYGATFDGPPSEAAGLPPLFMAVATDDPIAYGPVLAFYEAVHGAGGKPDLHVYSSGGHGFGMRRQDKASDIWIEEFVHWLAIQDLARTVAP